MSEYKNRETTPANDEKEMEKRASRDFTIIMRKIDVNYELSVEFPDTEFIVSASATKISLCGPDGEKFYYPRSAFTVAENAALTSTLKFYDQIGVPLIYHTRTLKKTDLYERVKYLEAELDVMKKKIFQLQEENSYLKEMAKRDAEKKEGYITYKKEKTARTAEVESQLEGLKLMEKKKETHKEEATTLFTKNKERCYKCGVLGHHAAECRNQGIMCYKCRRCEGHTAENCPYKDYGEQDRRDNTRYDDQILRRGNNDNNRKNFNRFNYKRKNNEQLNNFDEKRYKLNRGKGNYHGINRDRANTGYNIKTERTEIKTSNSKSKDRNRRNV